MEREIWKFRDEDVFSGIPHNGKCAEGREGDLADIFNKCIHEGFKGWERDYQRFSEYFWDDEAEKEVSVPVRAQDLPQQIASHIDFSIEYAMDKNEGPFYIGRLPPAGSVAIGTSTDMSAPVLKEKKLYLNYFADGCNRIRGLEEAQKEVDRLRGYVRHPLKELLQLILRMLLGAFSLLQVAMAANELPGYDGFLKVSGLPLFYTGGESGFLFWNGLGWFALGMLVTLFSFMLDTDALESLGAMGAVVGFGHLLVSVGHGLCALRIPVISPCAAALLIVAELVFLLIYALACIRLLFRFFRRLSRRKRIPADYEPDFIMNAAYCYRSCRLRILWYENVTGKKGPGGFTLPSVRWRNWTNNTADSCLYSGVSPAEQSNISIY